MSDDEGMIVCEVVDCEQCGRRYPMPDFTPDECGHDHSLIPKVHVTPGVNSDARMHVLDETCWCLPIQMDAHILHRDEHTGLIPSPPADWNGDPIG